MAKVIDVCCGSRMFWFDKKNPQTVFMDYRELETELCDGRKLIIKPGLVGDFRKIPFADETFQLAVFDDDLIVFRDAVIKMAEDLIKKYYLKDAKKC